MPKRSLLMMVIITWLDASSTLHADGGAVRAREQSGRYLITAFTSPTPFRQGIVDISVLVQDPTSGECVNDTSVTIRLEQRGTQNNLIQHATSSAATNKLFQAALFELPAPGWWVVTINIDGAYGSAQVQINVEADQPAPRWQSLWPWYSWPILVILLFGYLVHSRPKQV